MRFAKSLLLTTALVSLSAAHADIALPDEKSGQTKILYREGDLVKLASCAKVDDAATRDKCEGKTPSVQSCLRYSDYLSLYLLEGHTKDASVAAVGALKDTLTRLRYYEDRLARARRIAPYPTSLDTAARIRNEARPEATKFVHVYAFDRYHYLYSSGTCGKLDSKQTVKSEHQALRSLADLEVGKPGYLAAKSPNCAEKVEDLLHAYWRDQKDTHDSKYCYKNYRVDRVERVHTTPVCAILSAWVKAREDYQTLGGDKAYAARNEELTILSTHATDRKQAAELKAKLLVEGEKLFGAIDPTLLTLAADKHAPFYPGGVKHAALLAPFHTFSGSALNLCRGSKNPLAPSKALRLECVADVAASFGKHAEPARLYLGSAISGTKTAAQLVDECEEKVKHFLGKLDLMYQVGSTESDAKPYSSNVSYLLARCRHYTPVVKMGATSREFSMGDFESDREVVGYDTAEIQNHCAEWAPPGRSGLFVELLRHEPARVMTLACRARIPAGFGTAAEPAEIQVGTAFAANATGEDLVRQCRTLSRHYLGDTKLLHQVTSKATEALAFETSTYLLNAKCSYFTPSVKVAGTTRVLELGKVAEEGLSGRDSDEMAERCRQRMPAGATAFSVTLIR